VFHQIASLRLSCGVNRNEAFDEPELGFALVCFRLFIVFSGIICGVYLLRTTTFKAVFNFSRYDEVGFFYNYPIIFAS